MRGFHVEKLTSGKSDYGVDIQGLDKAPIYDISISDSTFEKVAKGNIIKNVQGIKLNKVKFNGAPVTELKAG